MYLKKMYLKKKQKCTERRNKYVHKGETKRYIKRKQKCTIKKRQKCT